MPLTMSNLATAVLELPESPWIDVLPSEMALTYAEHMHCEANVRLWKTYLPEDCVNTMIAMGWDLST
jgi:hypothetical protein